MLQRQIFSFLFFLFASSLFIGLFVPMVSASISLGVSPGKIVLRGHETSQLIVHNPNTFDIRFVIDENPQFFVSIPSLEGAVCQNCSAGTEACCILSQKKSTVLDVSARAGIATGAYALIVQAYSYDTDLRGSAAIRVPVTILSVVEEVNMVEVEDEQIRYGVGISCTIVLVGVFCYLTVRFAL